MMLLSNVVLLSNMVLYDGIYLFRASSSSDTNKAQKLSKVKEEETRTTPNCQL